MRYSTHEKGAQKATLRLNVKSIAMSKDKKSLRTTLRAKRDTIGAAERTQASLALLRHLCTQDWFPQKQTFAVYYPMASEIDIKPVIDSLWQHQKKCYLPRIMADGRLVFALYTEQSALISNRFGISEPNDNAALCPLNELDVIFIPLLAFDEQGHRLGMGAGFYDKTLASLAEQRIRPLLVGLAYELQKVDRLPQDPWDVSLDMVVTERGVYFA